MPSFGLDELPGARGTLRFPFRGHHAVHGKLHESREHRGEGLGRRFLQGQHLNVVVVQPQVIAVTFETGVAGLEIDKGFVFQANGIRLIGRVIQESAENPEGPLGVEQIGFNKVPQLDGETGDSIVEGLDGLRQFFLQGDTTLIC